MPQFPLNEKYLSQIPALQQLINLGYEYLTPEQALEERGGRLDNVLLEKTLRAQLEKMNRFRFKGQEHRFNPENIGTAIDKLKNIRLDGLLKTNEEIYDLLTLGTALTQSVEGGSKSFTLNYIDWENPDNNRYQLTAEFKVAGGKEAAIPDIVLFVNGIPLAVIECKAPDIKVDQGISQMIRNQRPDYIPRLFIYAQVLVATNRNRVRYATAGTKKKQWSVWREQEIPDSEIEESVNVPLSEEVKEDLFSGDFAQARGHFEQLGNRQITEQDKVLHCLCLPQRLLEIIGKFTVFDAGEKKIARYQQFFVARATVERIRQSNQGGMIWHTQGSGKSLTMVWIARLLAEALPNPQIVMVTDRVDLDKQIEKVFRQCGIEPKRATTGENLLTLLANRQPMVTTLVHKFETAFKAKTRTKNNIDDAKIIALVDESHRTQFGTLSGAMRALLPQAIYVGFTGTPLTKEQKNNFARFGSLIEPSYLPRQALEDKAIVPLLHEMRKTLIEQDNKKAVDLWFERHTSELNEKQKADLKRKYSRAKQLSKAERVVYMKAFDIREHYISTWKGTGFKAQLVAPDKKTAIKYHGFLQEFGDISSEVIISAPDLREGFDQVDSDTGSEVHEFWGRMMQRFGSEAEYNDRIIEKFKDPGEPEILIVVDKLLTGFDAPRNTVLYLCRTLREHTLLQAIARVNRLHDGKEYGYIVDYEGILEELDNALTMYDALSAFDEKDLEHVLTSINQQLTQLPQTHAALWDLFKTLANKKDEEAYERLLADEAIVEKTHGVDNGWVRPALGDNLTPCACISWPRRRGRCLRRCYG
ncbi:MAG: Type-1 restriction enzyme R protein [Verrucomicrobia subdivision 3 bacterium]|nr:Type-1 restriction enzyme R protein [Limisphaerales bacterium]